MKNNKYYQYFDKMSSVCTTEKERIKTMEEKSQGAGELSTISLKKAFLEKKK